LLQSGVDLTVIQRWLGHVQLATTHAYVEIDLEMKRKALAACSPPLDGDKSLCKILADNRDVIRLAKGAVAARWPVFMWSCRRGQARPNRRAAPSLYIENAAHKISNLLCWSGAAIRFCFIHAC
jgi:hypothetical protein